MASYNSLAAEKEIGWPERVFGLGRCTSMEVQNDPRFFTNNVIDKRLAALKTMTIVTSIMLGTALSQCFSLEKKYNFTEDAGCFTISAVQIISFFILMRVVFVCFVALYTFCIQLYHIYRLMTSGPTGVESAGEYYLHPIIVTWRHTAVNRLLKTIKWFVIALGIVLTVKIMKDGGTIKRCYDKGGGGKKEPSLADIAVLVTSIMNNVTVTTPEPPAPKKEDVFMDTFQPILAVVVLCSFFICAYVLNHINSTHTREFERVYAKVKEVLPSQRSWAQASFVENYQSSLEHDNPNAITC